MKLDNLDRPLMVVVSFNIHRVLWNLHSNSVPDILDPTTGGGAMLHLSSFLSVFLHGWQSDIRLSVYII